MNAFEILEFTHKFFPFRRPENIDFEEYVQSVLTEYSEKVLSSEELFKLDGVSNPPYNLDKYLSEFKKFNQLINEAITKYLEGYPSVAFKAISDAISTITEDRNVKYINGSGMVAHPKFQFYRIRTQQLGRNFKRQELFHIPFSKRRMIKTNRYSIPGFPSLYLSNSIYVAWEELGRPKFEHIHASRFEIKKLFAYLNLTTESYFHFNPKDQWISSNLHQALDAIFRFPLVFACSIKVNNNEDVFRPEYIIPQLLLQWLRSDGIYDGIAYSSSHIDLTNKNFEGRFRNYVIPVKPKKEEFCSNIKRIFKMTEVLSSEMLGLNQNPNYTFMNEGNDYTNEGATYIEIINSQKSYYPYTKFAQLEEALERQVASEIDF